MGEEQILDLTSITFEEVVRLVNDLAERLTNEQHLAAVSTSRAIVARAADLVELCSQATHLRTAGSTGLPDDVRDSCYL